MLFSLIFSLFLTQPVQESSITHRVVIPGTCFQPTEVSIPPFDTSLGTLIGVRIDPGLEIDWGYQLENRNPDAGSAIAGIMSWSGPQHDHHIPTEVGPFSQGDSWRFIRARVKGTYEQVGFFKRYCPTMYPVNAQTGSRWSGPYDGVTDFKGPSSLNVFAPSPMLFKGGSYREDAYFLDLVSNPYDLEIFYGYTFWWSIKSLPGGYAIWSTNMQVTARSAIRIEYFYV
jgi:hypothetical protein